MQAYAPRGPSCEPGLFKCLSDWPTRHYIVEALEREGIRLGIEDYSYNIEHLFDGRLSQPTFHSLCALLNSYFKDWDRIIIIERLAYVEPLWYGYVVLAFTPEGPKAVTNMVADPPSPWDWESRLQPRKLSLDRKRLLVALSELDKQAEVSTKTGLLWFDAIDMPIFVLHYVKRDGVRFSFGISGFWHGYGPSYEEWSESESVSLFKERKFASDVFEKAEAWEDEIVQYNSSRGKELMKVGASYARLMAFVWEAIMGLEDATIRGKEDRL